ncbi:hypothetical protein SAMN04487857_101518 [Pseudomonas sp. ok272]|uniref:DUF6311 domain-containing protein n=1 Tax=unclassified Pseudomonas TaxID=196821 RepID=UPI0008B2C435|nr:MULTISPECIES: DUF6311 domain-containing protein [unclassified Pseudomonas]SEM39100.1 hypothetical protein SAMN04487857_101518 [Pseudomonas sp. ok272]SFM39953.1 hypothetical protein SAMN04487858_102520 [Pseudomonas sp. ok602]
MRFNFSARRLVTAMLPVLMGLVALLIVAGPRVLNPMNIAWLAGGDPATHYQGWQFFRYSPWTFPLGLNPGYGLELSNGLIFSDSIPLFALLFKPFSALLPEPFQYFGLWFLMCFVLQSWFAWKLMGLASNNVAVRLLGAGLFLFMPAMILRMGVHLSLAGHFLILAALYLSLRPSVQRRRLGWGVLLAASALVHAYLLAMVLLIWMADLLARTIARQLTWRKVFLEWLGLLVLVALCCWQVGYFGVGGDGLGSSGFGLYRANVLTFFNAAGWSYALNDIPGFPGDIDGLAFIGLGGLFLAVCALPVVLSGNVNVTAIARKRAVLLLAVLALALYAFSNRVGVGSWEFGYWLPEPLITLASLFRASGRMIWPLMYLVIFSLLWVVVRGHSARTAILLLAAALVMQVIDTRAGGAATRSFLMASPGSTWKTPLVDPFWQRAASHYQKVRWIRPQNYSNHWMTLADYAGRYQLGTDAVYLARVDGSALEQAQRKARLALESGKYEANSLYFLDQRSALQAVVNHDSSADVLAVIDGFNVLAPGWKRCADCPPINNAKSLEVVPQAHPGERLPFMTQGKGADYLAKGWSPSETWGTWSDGKDAEIILRPTSQVHSLLLEASPWLAPTLTHQDVAIRVNDVAVFTTRLTQAQPNMIDIALPAEVRELVAQQGMLRIQFHLPNAASPQALGVSEDGRELGIGILALTVN